MKPVARFSLLLMANSTKSNLRYRVVSMLSAVSLLHAVLEYTTHLLRPITLKGSICPAGLLIFVLFISTHLVTARPEPICRSNSRISHLAQWLERIRSPKNHADYIGHGTRWPTQPPSTHIRFQFRRDTLYRCNCVLKFLNSQCTWHLLLYHVT